MAEQEWGLSMARAVVIKTAGDKEIAGAIVDGISRNITPLNEAELAVVTAELTRLKAAYGVMKERDDRYWADKMSALESKYGTEPSSKVADALTLAWATVWTVLQGWIEYFQRWNREV